MQNRWSKIKALFWEAAADDDSDDGEMAEALATLKELQGVVGSIAIDRVGRVRAYDLPRVFDAAMVELIGVRMLELRSVLTTSGQEPLSGSLEFEGHSFQLRAFAHGMVGVLLDDGAHRPTIGMALNLVSRRVAAKLEAASDPGIET
ncbi:MAG TPA: hypothetical protein VI197_28505 [Polyangiaceae bacterium]